MLHVMLASLDKIIFCRRYSELHVVLEYVKWALDRDEEMAVQIFTEREDKSSMSPSQVLDILSPFKLATMSYLEHIVHVQDSKVSPSS